MMSCSRPASPLSVDTVYREANKNILPFIDQMIEESLVESSEIQGFDNLRELFEKAKNGSACLLLAEHFSNFDLPVLSYLLRQKGNAGREIEEALIAIAGIKLDEECSIVATFAEAYRRIVICPTRTQRSSRGNAINRAAAKEIRTEKTRGNIVLVFPAGTRHRPWDSSTQKGQREIDSYIKSFDSICLLSINGNILRVQEENGMAEDLVYRDQVIIRAGTVISCRSFRDTVRKQTPLGADKKQAVADEVMRRLAFMHREVSQQVSVPPSVER